MEAAGVDFGVNEPRRVNGAHGRRKGADDWCLALPRAGHVQMHVLHDRVGNLVRLERSEKLGRQVSKALIHGCHPERSEGSSVSC